MLIKQVANMMQFFTVNDLETPVRNGGFYDRVLYRNWYSVDVAKNATEASSCCGELPKDVNSEKASLEYQHQTHTDPTVEMRPSGSRSTSARNGTSNLQNRLLGPKRLCFVNEPFLEKPAEYLSLEVSEWQERHPEAGVPNFLFVSYTSHHFPTQSKETLNGAFGAKMSPTEKADRSQASKENRRALTELAAKIARGKGLDAFWIDFESGIDHTGASDDDDDPGAYAICDILRASKSMIIVAGSPYNFPTSTRNEGRQPIESTNELLRSWGERLWTLPELLFCPNSDGIPIHTLNDHPPKILSKHTIASILKDGKSVRELIEHYSGTIQLSPLELTVTATQCLFARPHNQFSPGDASYALMGLMRRRPRVNKKDSAFKAFARLSFLNDNDRLMERLICLQPDLNDRQPWSSLYDSYQASLWDIEPCTQVAGIVNAQPARDASKPPRSDKASALDETQIIVLDGAFGAAIKWERLEPVAFMKRATLLQIIARIMVRGFSVWFFYGLILTFIGAAINSYSPGAGSATLGAGLPVLIPCLIAIPFLPTLVRRLYAGKLWATQAAFFGVQGIPQLSEVERCIFGFNQDRLTWSTHGSTLSKAKIDPRTGELLPLVPVEPERIPNAPKLETFTLIDTFTLTATAFQAERLPVAAIICGQEGGMQRALLCSYDPVSRAFCKETVLRMKTTCLERMPRMDRFRFAMRRE
jgi:hypothetical protein